MIKTIMGGFMKRSLTLMAFIVIAVVFAGCGLEEFCAKQNYIAQEGEGQTVLDITDLNAAYYAARRILTEDGLKIVNDSQSAFPIHLIGESYKQKSEGDRLKGTLVMNLMGGKKATEKVVDKEVKSRTFIIKPRYDEKWKFVAGKVGLLYFGDIIGRNGQGAAVETIESSVTNDEKNRVLTRFKTYMAEYIKDPSKMK
jgi:hypothetical protein